RPGALGYDDPLRALVARSRAARTRRLGGAPSAPRARAGRSRRSPREERVRAGALGRRAARVCGDPRAALRPAGRVRHAPSTLLPRTALGDDRAARRLGAGHGEDVRLPPPLPAAAAARRAEAHLAAEDAGPPGDARSPVRDLSRRVGGADA